MGSASRDRGPRAGSRGGLLGKEATGELRFVEWDERWDLGATPVEDVGAAVLESAAGRKPRQVGHHARDGREAGGASFAPRRDRPQEAPRVGMRRGGKQPIDR